MVPLVCGPTSATGRCRTKGRPRAGEHGRPARRRYQESQHVPNRSECHTWLGRIWALWHPCAARPVALGPPTKAHGSPDGCPRPVGAPGRLLASSLHGWQGPGLCHGLVTGQGRHYWQCNWTTYWRLASLGATLSCPPRFADSRPTLEEHVLPAQCGLRVAPSGRLWNQAASYAPGPPQLRKRWDGSECR